MRIFIGIDLVPEVRARIARFAEGVQGFASEARWVRPESLHITLKFIV
jgi:2'-5' RNA ligase